jgi:hypothetical protein
VQEALGRAGELSERGGRIDSLPAWVPLYPGTSCGTASGVCSPKLGLEAGWPARLGRPTQPAPSLPADLCGALATRGQPARLRGQASRTPGLTGESAPRYGASCCEMTTKVAV